MNAKRGPVPMFMMLVFMVLVASIPARANQHGSDDASSGSGMMGDQDTENMDDQDMDTMLSGLLMPVMNPARGRKVFGARGCVVCHKINGVGGDQGPSLDMSRMGPMNPFDFVAKMWRGAEAMIALQEEELGAQIELTGQDLADIIAFVHSPTQIAKFSRADVPHKVLDVLKQTQGEEHDDNEGSQND